MLKTFTLSELASLDYGKLDAAFNFEMQRMIEDLNDRPDDERARSITLQVLIVPEEMDKGKLITAATQFKLEGKIPKRQTRVYSMRVSGRDLLFNEESADDANQMTLDEVVDNEGEVHKLPLRRAAE